MSRSSKHGFQSYLRSKHGCDPIFHQTISSSAMNEHDFRQSMRERTVHQALSNPVTIASMISSILRAHRKLLVYKKSRGLPLDVWGWLSRKTLMAKPGTQTSPLGDTTKVARLKETSELTAFPMKVVSPESSPGNSPSQVQTLLPSLLMRLGGLILGL
eukprot:8854031-Pyramimonas_sp.AAC.1